MATATLTPKEGIRFERATGSAGAWVHGAGLGAAPDPIVTDALTRALHEYGVLFFDVGRVPSSEEFAAFAELFGEVEGPFGQRIKGKTEESPYIDQDKTPMKDIRTNRWHYDGGPLATPPQAALLTPVELPETGGDTMWANMYAAWEALSPRYQSLLDGLEVLNNNARLSFLEPREFVHPAAPTDPITGRKFLYVCEGYSQRLLGLAEKESDSLLRFLFDHVNTPEFHVRLRWRLGVIAVWEERLTQHRAVADCGGPRKLRRLTIKGPPPAA
jgi:taurine dioxygenase